MARSMRLFLIRHGETVDNVAQLYAGSRDSALTNHGYQQATRLGLHFNALGLTFTHLFSSHLQRAVKTADLIRKAQLSQKDYNNSARDLLELAQLRILMEQDFGDLEGKKWTDTQAELQNKPGFVAVETKEATGRRADTFLDDHLLPLLGETTGGSNLTIAIVSHGIFLSTLWKRLLRRLPAESITLSPDLQSTARPSLEHMGGWSNTGYLELHMTQGETEKSFRTANAAPSSSWRPDISHADKPETDGTIGAVEVPQAAAQKMTGDIDTSGFLGNDAKVINGDPAVAPPTTATTPHLSAVAVPRAWSTTIMTINGKDHLKGLKRTGGGVGSSRHDASQKSIESFFKRRKPD